MVRFYSTIPCTSGTCPNSPLLFAARELGLEVEFHFVSGMNAEIKTAWEKGIAPPFFTDGTTYAKTAQKFLDAQATNLIKKSKKK